MTSHATLHPGIDTSWALQHEDLLVPALYDVTGEIEAFRYPQKAAELM
jgi:hypothetical protein